MRGPIYSNRHRFLATTKHARRLGSAHAGVHYHGQRGNSHIHLGRNSGSPRKMVGVLSHESIHLAFEWVWDARGFSERELTRANSWLDSTTYIRDPITLAPFATFDSCSYRHAARALLLPRPRSAALRALCVTTEKEARLIGDAQRQGLSHLDIYTRILGARP